MLGKSIFKDTLLMTLVFIGAVAVIAGVAVVGTLFPRPVYHLGEKEQLLSDLKEYFAREQDVGVQVGNEQPFPQGGNDSSRYELTANHDSLVHGNLTISTWNGMVIDVTLRWFHGGDENLMRSGELIISGIADNTITDWQEEDGQPNRNVELFKWIDENLSSQSNEGQGHIDWDFGDRRVLNYGKGPDYVVMNVFIEP
ncbi:MAG TPA: hypothetical protein VIB07_05565 [Nitrososphaera sp.]|jgi:hypothetical protein